MPYLDRTIGFTRDESGAYYVATAASEGDSITRTYPSNDAYRSGVVYPYKVEPDGVLGFSIDLDPARHAFDPECGQLINPMVASTGRLAVADGRLALVHGINTQPDSNGTRHQMAMTTSLDAATGSVLSAG